MTGSGSDTHGSIWQCMHVCREALEETAGKGWGAVQRGEDWQSQSWGQRVLPALVGKGAGWAAGATGGVEPTPARRNPFWSTIRDHRAGLTESCPESKPKEPREARLLYFRFPVLRIIKAFMGESLHFWKL